MGSERRRWVWVIIVAVVAAVVWWLVPQGTSPSQEPDEETAPDEPALVDRAATKDWWPEPEAHTGEGEPEGADAPPPGAEPLPREAVELPRTSGALDAGVRDDAPIDVAERRDAMLGKVLDRLREDLQAAEEANDTDEAARLRVRIERLEARQRELSEP